MAASSLPAVALGAFFVVVGTTHGLLPSYYRRLVPPWVPAPGAVVAVTGVAEVLAGTAVLVPATREAGAWSAAALVAVYLVGHLDAARHARADRPSLLDRPAGAALRVVANVAYLAWAVAVARGRLA